MNRLVSALFASVALLTACDSSSGFQIPTPKDLAPGGVFVSYNLGCTAGCDQIKKGDLIQAIDGKPMTTGRDFDAANVTDGKPHTLDVLDATTKTKKQVSLTATPKELPPLKSVPPFWTVGAADLNGAPDWARRRMFGHASPMVMLVSIDGGIFDGRQLFGQKRFIVYWDQGTRIEQGQAITFLKVLQKAQADLKGKGIDVMFAQLQFPNARQQAMNDSDLRTFQAKWSEKGADGAPLPAVPMYRFPNTVEFNRSRELGLENAYTVFENLGASPTIVLLDERGIVRWHSEKVTQPPAGHPIQDATQYTIISAIEYALAKL